MNLLLIGSGKWGQKYISTLSAFENINLKIANRNNWKQLIDEKPDGVMICTPPDVHIEITSYALERNLATMVEKPLSLSLDDTKKLQQFDCSKLLVNHIHLFASEYQTLKKRISNEEIKSISSFGIGSGPYKNYSSLWDYGSHDISMILDLTNNMPKKIKAKKVKSIIGELFNLKMYFNGFNTESLIGNGSKDKIRCINISIPKGNISYNDNDDRNDGYTPPLTNALNVFINCINGKIDSRLGLDLSLKVIEVLEECDRQLGI